MASPIYCVQCDITHPPQGMKPRRHYSNCEFVLSREDYIVCRCGCWLWRWTVINKNKLPKINNMYHKKGQSTAQRIIFNVEDNAGVIKMQCGNHRCVNIAHHQIVPKQTVFNETHGVANYEIAEKIRDEYNNSKITQIDLAIKYDIGYGVVTKILSNERYTTDTQNLVVAEKPARYYTDEIMNLRNLGYSYKYIAKKLDLRYQAVYTIVRRNT